MSDHDRRSFLKLAGFTLLTGCSRGLEHKAIPLLFPVEEVTPGTATWYASMCDGCAAGCGVLVKNRDGRPIKLEGNPGHPDSKGGLCAAGQAGLLSLYDSHRLTAPRIDGKPATWAAVDEAVRARLGGAVRFLTGTVHGPTLRASIQAFGRRFADFRHVQYDALSCSALLDVHEEIFGRRALPTFRFDLAEEIVSFDADFLGTWIAPVEYTRGLRLRHVQVESRMSITGTNADKRVVVAPDEVPWELTEGLVPGRSLVVSGSDDIDVQRRVAHINHKLGNYGRTLAFDRVSYQKQGSRRDLEALRREIAAGRVKTLLVAGCNPVYDVGLELDKVETVISFSERVDETAEKAHFVCPDHHPLEGWGDGEAHDGHITVRQPAVRPLHATRAVVESLAAFSGKPRDALEIMRATWGTVVFPRQKKFRDFDLFWSQAVHDGFVAVDPVPVAFRPPPDGQPKPAARPEGKFAAVLYPTVAMLDGRHAHNPWLHELPDPVTKIVWDNYACLSPAAARKLDVEQGDLVDVDGVTLPVVVQTGQHDDVVAIPIGYGRKGTDRFRNVGPEWLEGDPTLREGELVGVRANGLPGHVTVKKAGGHRELACTQPWESLTVPGGEKRPMVRTEVGHGDGHGPGPAKQLWPDDHKFPGHHWGMSIDLSRCTGCAACVVSCQAENNVPVVGKDEVRRFREMHWIRIDRYYDEYGTAAHQPMLCQHCDNAPCETVCPVLATVQSEEGLNQQVYNRCVGTRYCANNCPYKMRRFNWFDYPREDRLLNMMLNPDVVVRSRGVMEKCSFCVQRIAEAKRDGTVATLEPACAQSCPADAIVFGDVNDETSAIREAWNDERHYFVLEELNTKPRVGYRTLVRNRDV